MQALARRAPFVCLSLVLSCSGGQLEVDSQSAALTPVPPFTKIATGAFHACAIGNDASLWCWGQNVNSQLGDNTIINRLVPTRIGAASWLDVAAGTAHTCAVKSDGTVWCWGADWGTGRVGLNGIAVKSPTQVTLAGSFTHVTAGLNHSCAVDSTGLLYCWGTNNYGQLGDGTLMTRLTPGASIGSGYSAIAAGTYHTCGLKGTALACWGLNNYGQLTGATTQSTTPVAIAGSWLSVITGGYHSCGVKTGGAGFCWGLNSTGQLGDGTVLSRRVATAIAGAVSWTALSGGALHTCGRGSDGVVRCWGADVYGQLGDGLAHQRNSPGAVVGSVSDSAVAAGGTASCKLDAAGALTCWGSETWGQTADGINPSKVAPTQIGALTTWAETSTGSVSGCGIQTNGTLWCWGTNANGQLGLGNNDSAAVPTQIPGTTWKHVAAGYLHTCATKTDGTLWCWGLGSSGQLGAGTASSLVPKRAGLATNWDQISVGTYFSCAITTANALFCFGYNGFGQIGNGTVVSQTTPTQIPGTWLAVSTGDAHTCAVRSDGTLWCWGLGTSGQLGTGGGGSNVPGRVAIGTTWTAVSAGFDHTCGMLGGAPFCWGLNTSSRLGDNTAVNRLTPTAVSWPAGSPPASLRAGNAHTCGLDAAGKLFCWGANVNGELGDGTLVNRKVPTPIGASVWSQLAPGNNFTCGISAGALFCWGNNSDAQIPDATAWRVPPVTPTCSDLAKNGAETDVDCGGGTCPACGVNKGCLVNSDCASSGCDATTFKCDASQCADGHKDGAETDLDCGGGACPGCGANQSCLVNTDCATNACDSTTLKCDANQCADGHKDGAETDVDCGGGSCLACAIGKGCLVDSDCTTAACDTTTQLCAADQCADRHKDGSETDIDCGGSCAGCVVGKVCAGDSDCASNACDATTLLCDSSQCADGRKDGAETDLDCGGGTCGACAVGKGCAGDSDCATGACDATTLLCDANQCADGRKDGAETDLDCGGGTCGRCAFGKACLAGTDCTSGTCTANLCGPTVPDPPTSPIAFANNGSAWINFTQPANNGGATVTTYTAIAFPGGKMGTVSNSRATAVQVTGLTNGTSYAFKLTAANSVGVSVVSTLSNSVTPATSTVPGPPSLLATGATAGDGTVSVAFGTVGGSTSYVVTGMPGNVTTTGLTIPLVVTGLTDGVSYTFWVAAVNANGTGPHSVISTNPVTAAHFPGAPTNVIATPGNGTATLTFSPPASNGGAPVTVYTATSLPDGITGSSSGSPITVTHLTAGVSYTFTVKATNSSGTGAASSASNAVIPAAALVPGAPTGVTGVPWGDGQVRLTLTPPVDDGGAAITSYTATATGGITATNSGGTTVLVKGLTDGTSYTFTVKATNSTGTGPASAATSGVTPVAPAAGKRVFVSSAMYNGNLGGLTGADAKCQGLATAAGLSGTFMAWVSTSTGSPSTRFTQSASAYRLVNGVSIAASYASLIAGSAVLSKINVTETGDDPPVPTQTCNTQFNGFHKAVYTGTLENGTRNGTANCSDWSATSSAGGSACGDYALTTNGWTHACSTSDCAGLAPIYCFEQ